MDTLARASQADLTGYVPAAPASVNPGAAPSQQPTTPYLRSSLPSSVAGVDTARQFFAYGKQPRPFMASGAQTASASVSSSASQAKAAAVSYVSGLTMNDIPSTSLYSSVPTGDLSGDGSLITAQYRGDWLATISYVVGDQVEYNGYLWSCLVDNRNSTPASSNTNWAQLGPTSLVNYFGAWSSTVTYQPGQQIGYGGYLWQATAQNVNSVPSTTNTNWALTGIVEYQNFTGVWSSTTTYNIGQEVSYASYIWQALASNTNSAPTTINTNWSQIGPNTLQNYQGSWSSGTGYTDGQQVTYSGNVYVALNPNTGIAPTNPSYWALIGPNSLDNVADGTTYQRPVGVTSGQTTTSTYASGSISANFSAYVPTTNVTVGSTTTVVGPITITTSGTLWITYSGTFDGTLIYVSILVIIDSSNIAEYVYPLNVSQSVPITLPITFWADGNSGHTCEIQVYNQGGGTVSCGANYLSIGVTKA